MTDPIDLACRSFAHEREHLEQYLAELRHDLDHALQQLEQYRSVPVWNPLARFRRWRLRRILNWLQRQATVTRRKIRAYEEAEVDLREGQYRTAISLLERLAMECHVSRWEWFLARLDETRSMDTARKEVLFHRTVELRRHLIWLEQENA